MNGKEKVSISLKELVLGIFASAILLSVANAGVAESDFSLVVGEEQTLQEFVDDELQLSQYASQIATYNGFDAGTAILPIGTTLKVPDSYMRLRDSGTVVFAKGDVVHTQSAMVVNPPAKGARVHQGDIFSTGEDGFVSLKFSSGSVVNVQPESRITIKDIACAEEQTRCVIALSAELGEIESHVTPRPDGQPPIEFSVTTPFLSAAVRGTSFYVNVDKGADRIGVTSGLVATEAAGAANDLPEGKGLLAEAGVAPALVDLLQAPELVPGAEELTIYSAEDTLRWKALEAAEQYRLTIAPDEAFTNPLLLEDVQENHASSTLGLSGGVYYLSVAGIDNKKFLGLPTIAQLSVAEIVDQERLVLHVNRANGVTNIEPIEYTGSVELLISNDFDNPTEQRRIINPLSEGLSIEMDGTQDWIIRARKIISPTTVSVYSDYYLLEGRK